MIASAVVMTGGVRSKAKIAASDWENRAWELYDTVGEMRAAVSWKANAMSRVNLVAARAPENPGDEPTPISLDDEGITPEEKRAVELVAEIAGGPDGQGQLLAAVTRLLEVGGVAFVYAPTDPVTDTFVSTWRVLSTAEVQRAQDELQVRNGETGDWETISESDLLLKVWLSHPRRSWEADSPMRGVLSTLDEIRVLSMRIKADAISRLTGAGLLLVDDSIEFAAGQGTPQSTEGEAAEDQDDFVDTLIAIASTAPIDLESPAATVPLVARMNGESVDKVRHIKFWSDLSSNADTLRASAVRRFALGVDLPPDVLLGLGDANHWSAWQIADEAITMHIEPRAETVCHALTKGFLHAAMKGEQLDPSGVMVWYDASDLSVRPDLTAAASEAHARLKISDDAYLGYIGLDASDKPSPDELRFRTLMDVAKGAPTLAPQMLAAVGLLPDAAAEAVAAETPSPAPEAPQDESTTVEPTTGPPDPQDATGAAMLAAADVLVHRAMERAGNRLRNAVGRRREGGVASVAAPDDVALMHTVVSATKHASVDELLAGAWDRVPQTAACLGVSAESMTACLDAYCRGLLASGHAHDVDVLAVALGVSDARHVLAPA